MTKLKVALVEDNKILLKDLKEQVESSALADVIVFATNSQELFDKLKLQKPDAILLDIDLGSDSLSGIELANKLKLPVLFISGNNANYLKEIEHLKREFDFPVDHITKPISEDSFAKTLKRFLNEVQVFHQRQFVFLDFKDAKRCKISVNDIVFLCTDKENGADSGNKVMYFTNRKPEVLVDFEFKTMQEKGFSPNQFVTTHKSFRLNIEKYISYDPKTHEILVSAMSISGKSEIKRVQVSENYRKVVPSQK